MSLYLDEKRTSLSLQWRGTPNSRFSGITSWNTKSRLAVMVLARPCVPFGLSTRCCHDPFRTRVFPGRSVREGPWFLTGQRRVERKPPRVRKPSTTGVSRPSPRRRTSRVPRARPRRGSRGTPPVCDLTRLPVPLSPRDLPFVSTVGGGGGRRGLYLECVNRP